MTHGRKQKLGIVAVVAVLAAGVSHAQPPPAPPPASEPAPPAEPAASPPEPEVPAAAASGLVVARDPDESSGRVAARVALFPVRALWYVLWSPVRLAAWAYDRFAIGRRARQVFFSEDGRLGVFPIAVWKSGFGPTGGVRMVVRDVLAPASRVRVEAIYGGEVLQAYKLHARTGRLLGRRAELDFRAEFETFPRSRFFGIGNGDLAPPPAMPVMPVDAVRDPTAVDTRFYSDAYTLQTTLALDLPGPFHVRPSVGFRIRDFDRDQGFDDELGTLEVYDPAGLIGFDGLATVYGGFEVVADTLRQPRFYLSKAAPSTGWYAVARAHGYHGTGDDPSDFVRWGIDVQRYLDLHGGDRVLALRAVYQGVTGSLARVPFIDLPALGGAQLLRGYDQDRFRDRQAGVASVEYQWGIDRLMTAFLFTDVGRVWRNRDDLATGDLRVGFGGGLQLHTMKSFLARVMIASSIDGGVFFLFSLDPLFERTRERSP